MDADGAALALVEDELVGVLPVALGAHDDRDRDVGLDLLRDVGVGEDVAADLDLQVLVVLVVGLEADRGDAGVEVFGLLSRGFLGVVVAAAPGAGRLLGDDDVVELGGVEEVAEGDVAVGERDRGAGAVPRELGLLEQGGGRDAVAALGGAEPLHGLGVPRPGGGAGRSEGDRAAQRESRQHEAKERASAQANDGESIRDKCAGSNHEIARAARR